MTGTRVQLYISQAGYKIGTTGAWLDPAEMSRHLTLNRNYPQVLGDMHFSAKDVRADRIGGVSRYVADHYTQPVLVPRMAHLPSRLLLAPLVTRATRIAGTGACNPHLAIPETGFVRHGHLVRHLPLRR